MTLHLRVHVLALLSRQPHRCVLPLSLRDQLSGATLNSIGCTIDFDLARSIEVVLTCHV